MGHHSFAVNFERAPGCRPGLLVSLLMAIGIGLATWLAASATAAARPAFSAIAVDAATGAIVYEQSIDAPRYPASLTKVMTLYLLFDDMRAGRVSLSTRFAISAHAAAQQPSKLGLKPGQSISVKDAIGALVTKSANDIAVAVAEGLEGSEADFARRMTRTARSIGMTRTTFRNASGLPDNEQKTTARDMATLGLRIQKDFPKEFHYFSTRSFTHAGRVHRNHNRLLGRLDGIDGIKTGYTRISGFNLIASIERGGKRVVGVVMGGPTGNARNAYMTKMLNRLYKTAKLQPLRAVAAMAGNPPGYVAKPVQQALFVKTPPLPRPKPDLPSGESSITVTEVAVGADTTDDSEDGAPAEMAAGEIPAPADETPSSFHSVVVETASKSDNLTVASVATLVQASEVTGKTEPQQKRQETSAPAHTITWTIQVGAFPTPEGAKSRLDVALASGVGVLDGKSAFTMKAEVSGDTVYRARFSGFNEKAARLACKQLKRKGLGCFPLAPAASAG